MDCSGDNQKTIEIAQHLFDPVQNDARRIIETVGLLPVAGFEQIVIALPDLELFVHIGGDLVAQQIELFFGQA
jgi:hypothetical protein